VEDEEGVRTLTRRMLERQGYRVLAAENGERALELAREHEGRVDLLVTDVVMPDMDGAKLAEMLAEKVPGLKVLYVSGYAPEMIAERGRLKEGADFLGKPFHTQDLLRRVREVLDR
jgi:two-component system, cell cycle sensor histidine kinase and response regulator CckA